MKKKTHFIFLPSFVLLLLALACRTATHEDRRLVAPKPSSDEPPCDSSQTQNCRQNPLPIQPPSKDSDRDKNKKFSWPLARVAPNTNVNFKFGAHVGGETDHLAIDIAAREGDSIYAIGEGEIAVLAYKAGNYLDIVVVRHAVPEPVGPNNSYYVYAAYCHTEAASELYVGKKVKQGDRLGWIREAPPYKPHLHFVMYDQAFFEGGPQSRRCTEQGIAKGCPPAGYLNDSNIDFFDRDYIVHPLSPTKGAILNPERFISTDR
ncbi:MAG: M23 family metallopeptidase [Oligoflexales bacterium]|nr:M23 family metallopeptidase [Oligoflexales bacterium]